jgi:hypothetical protein
VQQKDFRVSRFLTPITMLQADDIHGTQFQGRNRAATTQNTEFRWEFSLIPRRLPEHSLLSACRPPSES